MQCYLLTLLLLGGATAAGVFRPARVYEIFGSILSSLNLFAFLFCWALYAKGVLAPSSTDHGSTGSVLYDFYWGRELHPRLLGGRFDIKHWTNCRFGMMAWAVLPLCYAAKEAELRAAAGLPGLVSPSMAVCVLLMSVYVFKFFLWESGYLSSMDIAHDRAGFYTQWGCLVFVPAIYTAPAQYLVRNAPTALFGGAALAPLLLALVGLAAIYVTYDIDRQRAEFRSSKGTALVWGKAPEFITARYLTASGETRESLLLASGWWALARHLHYAPELLAAFCWSSASGFAHALPYFYFTFLAIMLIDRTLRDESKCAAKYGASWAEYCRRVRWHVLPGGW